MRNGVAVALRAHAECERACEGAQGLFFGREQSTGLFVRSRWSACFLVMCPLQAGGACRYATIPPLKCLLRMQQMCACGACMFGCVRAGVLPTQCMPAVRWCLPAWERAAPLRAQSAVVVVLHAGD